MSDHDHEEQPADQRLADAAAAGCEESQLLISRRAFMGLTASFFAWAHMPRHAEAAGTEPRLLIVLLRGGMDGLHIAVPFKDPDYVRLRGDLALNPATLLALDNDFGLHPSMPKFHAMYKVGDAALVHAIAPPLRIGSHFECQYNLEAGVPGEQVRSSTTGWLNRLLQELPAGNAVKMDAMQIGTTPLILAGPAPVVSWSPGAYTTTAELTNTIIGLYKRTDPVLHELLLRGVDADKLATGSGVADAPTPLQTAFRGAARLLNAETGPRIAVLNVDGWDTHTGQVLGLNKLLSGLDVAMDDFRVGMGANWSRTAVACVTEFGRTAAHNGRTGTDHGVGTVAFLMGGAIKGGKVVVKDWPGLAPNMLDQGRNLAATLDLRALFKGMLTDHLGVPRTLLDKRIFLESADVKPMEDLIRSPAPAPAAALSSVRAASPIGLYRQKYGSSI